MSDLLAATLIRDIPDFPKPGIVFKDITPVLQDPRAFREVVERMTAECREWNPSVIAGIESRGFIFGAPIALALDLPFVLVRKIGKLPADTLKEEYSLEYGTNTVEMHRDAVAQGDRVAIVDDLLATGGTAAAAARLVEALGGKPVGYSFLVELSFLAGRAILGDVPVSALIDVTGD
jgi:adenine phosphoribosyltransferase